MAKGDVSGKKIPTSVIFRHFLTLPEEQRVKLLQEYLAPNAKTQAPGLSSPVK